MKMEETFAEEQKIFKAKLNGIPDSLKEFDDNEHPPELIDEYWDLYESFPSIHRKTELINAYSMLEHGLCSLCEAYEKTIPNGKPLSDFKSRNNVANYKKYLASQVGIVLPKDEMIEEINFIQQIRNKLIHNGGVINTNNTALVKYINEHEMLALTDAKVISISAGYTVSCYQLIHGFFIQVFSLMPKKNITKQSR
ncbi:hypothetical protein ACED51_20885 [Photobacterium swingsii]|uniref:hypothetical protein n=1 Tax=Photobacterium swingsii TaxID=680026 RepID=UPI00352DA012